jgi:ribosome-associated protein
MPITGRVSVGFKAVPVNTPVCPLVSGEWSYYMQQIKLREEYIKLGQALKAAGLVESGVDAKVEILDGRVKVNGAVETQRGKKLYDGDLVEFDGEQIKIIK